MRKTIFIFTTVLIMAVCADAQIIKSKETFVRFFSEAPLENIEAINTKSVSLLNTETKEIVFKVAIKDFKFDKDLMREHFNENYMESTKYPVATFKGKLSESIDFSLDGTYEASTAGTLNIHGISKDRTLNGKFVIKNGVIELTTVFDIRIEDHGIEIPKIVFKNIAEVIEVTVKSTYN